uniref:Ig-like domain-containing protein n=1 Tax=Hucho hucho TaxID=62062 RepID=A0A4W5RAB0_9TELE
MLLWHASGTLFRKKLTLFISGSSYEEEIISATTEERVFESDGVTLSCNYTGSYSTDTLLWYQQYSRSKPEFLRYSFGFVDNAAGFNASLNAKTRSVPLTIQRLQLSDSAVYYCALSEKPGESFCHNSTCKHFFHCVKYLPACY